MASAKLLAIVAGATLLSVPDARADGGDTSLIHACVGKLLGVVRIVRAGQHCHHSETPLHWPAQASAGSAGPRGVQFFESHGTFTVPAGVTSVVIELWGGGGAAGMGVQFASGGGGGGGYVRTVVAVSPGQVIPVAVGQGGAASCEVDGGAGGDTSFGGLAIAGGGQGGSVAGQGGAGGTASPGGISSSGEAGTTPNGPGGGNGRAAQGSFAPARSAPGIALPGQGGTRVVVAGACADLAVQFARGQAGQLIVQW
jgi:hypothetical protein